MRWLRSLVAKQSLTILSLIALLWANLPYLVGYLVAESEISFGGFFIFEQDGFSYLAKMRQGAKGDWLLHLPYSTQAHQGVLVYAFYLILGKLAQGLNISLVAAYHLARIVGSGFLLSTGIRFVSQHAVTIRWQVISWFMLLFGGGLDWLISMIDPEYIAYASVAPDAFLYSVLFGPPHIIVALGLLLFALIGLLQWLQVADSEQHGKRLWWLGACGFVMALTRPEYVAVLLAVSGAYWLAGCVNRHQFLLREMLWIGLAELPAVGYALYVFIISKTHPVVAVWTAQNVFTSPTLVNLLAGIGLFLIPGVIGIFYGRWWRDEMRLMLFSWVLILPIMLYLPLSLNRRLIGGALFALVVPAGYWLDQHLLPWLAQARQRRVASFAFTVVVLVFISYPLLFGLGAISFVASRPDTLFLAADELTALDWLALQDDQQIVLSAEQTGNRIPAFTSAIPVLGHAVETLSIKQTRADVSDFYDSKSSSVEQQTILAKYDADLIWWGPAEREIGNRESLNLQGVELLFEHGEIQIWRGERQDAGK